jgi:hypothetical protein
VRGWSRRRSVGRDDEGRPYSGDSPNIQEIPRGGTGVVHPDVPQERGTPKSDGEAAVVDPERGLCRCEMCANTRRMREIL